MEVSIDSILFDGPMQAGHSPTPRSNGWLFAIDSGCLIRGTIQLKFIAASCISRFFRHKASVTSIILMQRITTVFARCHLAMFETRCWALCRTWKHESCCVTSELKMVLWKNMEKLLLGMDADAVVLYFEEGDGEWDGRMMKHDHSTRKASFLQITLLPRARWHSWGTMLHKIVGHKPRRPSDVHRPRKNDSWSSWWRYFTEICRTGPAKPRALGKIWKVEHLGAHIMIPWSRIIRAYKSQPRTSCVFLKA